MITSLIKQATINLQPEVEETKDWFGFGDPVAYEDNEDEDEDEDCDDYEDVEFEEGDEYEECDCEEVTEIHLQTNVDDLGFYDSLETINDSQVLIDFMEEVFKELDTAVPYKFFNKQLDDLYFIDISLEDDDFTVLVTVDLNGLESYLYN